MTTTETRPARSVPRYPDRHWHAYFEDRFPGEILLDLPEDSPDRTAIVTAAVFDELPAYNSPGQPTGPSPGRIFRTHFLEEQDPEYDDDEQRGLLVIVERDPEDEKFVYRRSYRLFVR